MNGKRLRAVRRTRSRGFILIEVLVALMLLVIGIWSALESMNYATRVSSVARGRVRDYAKVERVGLAKESRQKNTVSVPSDIEATIVSLRGTPRAGQAKTVDFKAIYYKVKQNNKKSDLMASSFFIVISDAELRSN